MLDRSNFDVALLEARAGQAAQLLRALANERRLMILCRLSEGEQTVGQLQALVGLSQSALSQHLALLREEGILATRRDGQTIWYRINHPDAVRLMATLADIYCPKDAQ